MPELISSQSLRARTLLEQGDYGHAFEEARAVLAVQADDLEALLVMADLALESNNRPLFQKMVDRVRRRAPTDQRLAALVAAVTGPYCSKVHARLTGHAEQLLARGEVEAALARARFILQGDSRRAGAHFVAGRAQVALGEMAGASESLGMAARLDPNRAHYWHELGLALHRHGVMAEAVKALWRARDREPFNPAIARSIVAAQSALPPMSVLPAPPTGPRDLLICGPEMNRRHGTGILLQRLFPDSTNFVTLRSHSIYDGVEEFGGANLVLGEPELTEPRRAERLRELLAPYVIRRILCVPYHACDFQSGWLARQITGAPLCTYVMDDQNVYADKVPDELARRLFSASQLRLAISPEMSQAYQEKFEMPFSPLPPILDSAAGRMVNDWKPSRVAANHCALIGTMWSKGQWRQLRRITRETGLKVDWFGYDSSVQTGEIRQQLAREGIVCRGMAPEDELVKSLANYPFLIVPSGRLDGTEDNEWLTRLSLPSRMIYVLVKTLTPMLVLGHPDTAAGRFVTRFGVGLCTTGEVTDARFKIKRMTDPEIHGRFVQCGRKIADCFVMADAGDWIWRSLAGGKALPTPFGELLSPPIPDPATADELAGTAIR